MSQINSASKSVKTYIEINQELPNYITVSNKQITTSQFLQLQTSDILNIHSGSTSPISIKSLTNPVKVLNTYKLGNITETEYIGIATRLNNYINTYKKVPSYSTSSLGNINFESLIYMFLRIITDYMTQNGLPNQVSMINYT
jgi:hypothetical protein